MNTLDWVAAVIGFYLAIGLVVGLVFVAFAGRRVDPRLSGSSRSVRVLLLPGAVMLWPIVAKRIATGHGGRSP